MKWKGIVSQLAHRTMATTFAAANATHRRSIGLGRLRGRKPISHVADGFDRRGPELLAQSPDADVDDVRAWIEVVAPHVGKQLLPAADLAVMRDEVAQKLELAIGEIDDLVADPRSTAREVELERAR